MNKYCHDKKTQMILYKIKKVFKCSFETSVFVWKTSKDNITILRACAHYVYNKNNVNDLNN